MSLQPTDAAEFVNELGAGILAQKLGHLITQNAAATMDHQRQSSITLTLVFKNVGENQSQINVSHKLQFKRPTKRGDKAENELDSTVMYVAPTSGQLSLFPEKPFSAGEQGALLSKESQA